MTTGRQDSPLYKQSETPRSCAQCGKETKWLVNITRYEVEPEWVPLCDSECESEFEDDLPDGE